MATGGDTFPIWDQKNLDQQELVYYTPYRRLLGKAGVVLRTNLRTDDVLPHLLQLDVLDRIQMESITHYASRAVIVDRLIAFLQTGEMWRLHGLLRACAITGQKQLIEKVGLKQCDYITEEEGAQLPGTPTEPSCQRQTMEEQSGQSATTHSSPRESLPPELLRVIVQYCKNCKRSLMRRNLYDFGDKDATKAMDTAPCHIQIDPLQEGEHGKMTEIAEKDILVAFPDEEHPRVIRLEGQPGVGKTALTHHIVYDWSVEFLRRVGEAIPIEVGGDLLTMIVYIAAREIKTTVDEAILDSLRCAKEDQRMLYNHVTKGKGTAIALDAIDEIRNVQVMENVKAYVKDRQKSGDGPCVLVTARTDLCPIDIRDFDRFLMVKGFSQSQGIHYIQAFFRKDEKTCQKVLDYVHGHQEKLYSIVTNPLRLHIFCALVSEGELQLDENDNVCFLKLFTLLEQCLLRREGKKVTKVELHNFYKMCLHGLLNGLREFPRDLLDQFNIAEGCHVFFTKKDVKTVMDKRVTYSFPHELMFEMFAGKCIETLSLENRKSLVISVCAKPALRNLQKIMFEVLLQEKQQQQELLLLMIRAIFILQHDAQEFQNSQDSKEGLSGKVKRLLQKKSLHDEMILLKAKVQPIESIAALLLQHPHPTKIKNTSHICRKINKAFDSDPGFLRKVKWYEGLGNGVFGHVTECLLDCSPKQRETLTSRTTDHLLPCTYRDGRARWHNVQEVGVSRWAEIVQCSDEVEVHAWCPADAKEIMYKARTSGFSPEKGSLYLYLNTYGEKWGQPDSTALSTQAWNELSEEIIQWKDGESTRCELHLSPSAEGGFLGSNIGRIVDLTKFQL